MSEADTGLASGQSVSGRVLPFSSKLGFGVGQLAEGGVMELATKYQNVREKIPRHSH